MNTQPSAASLAPTALINSDHPDVIAFARQHAQGANDRERAAALYLAVRDQFRYDPYRIDLTATCQPRREPEIVFGMKTTPPANASLQQLFEAIDWIAPGFEVVQSHCLDWKFTATDTMADSGLHARLLVGQRLPVQQLAADAQALHTLLAQAQVTLFKNGQAVEQGNGTNVLDSPLNALHHFLKELRQCPGAVDLQAGDVVTTGTWTDAWPLQVGENWRAEFSAPLGSLSARMC